MLLIGYSNSRLIIIVIFLLSTTSQKHYPNLGSDEHAKKVVSDSPGPVDFAIGLVIFFLNLTDSQVLFWGGIRITEGL